MDAFSFPMNAGTFFLMVFYALVFGSPVYACNSFANISKIVPFLGTPVDFNKTMKDGNRIFGDHKTWRGIIFGIIFGTLTGVLVWYLAAYKRDIFIVYPWYVLLQHPLLKPYLGVYDNDHHEQEQRDQRVQEIGVAGIQ